MFIYCFCRFSFSGDVRPLCVIYQETNTTTGHLLFANMFDGWLYDFILVLSVRHQPIRAE